MYFIDVQGTLIDDVERRPVRGAVECLEAFNRAGTPYMVITNNTKQPSESFRAYLNSVGLAIDEAHYLDPLMLLESRLAKTGIAAYGSDEFLRVIASMGYVLDYEDPECVLLAIKEDFQADEYAQMIDFLLRGAKLVGMHETTLYAKHGRRYPGVGAILKMLQFATSAPYEVVGKPSRAFYDEALHRLRAQDASAGYEAVTIISDDVKGDLAGAAALGMKTVFVLSGKYRRADEIVPQLSEEEKPDAVCADIGEFMEGI